MAMAAEKIAAILAAEENDPFTLLNLPGPALDALDRPKWDVEDSAITRQYRRVGGHLPAPRGSPEIPRRRLPGVSRSCARARVPRQPAQTRRPPRSCRCAATRTRTTPRRPRAPSTVSCLPGAASQPRPSPGAPARVSPGPPHPARLIACVRRAGLGRARDQLLDRDERTALLQTLTGLSRCLLGLLGATTTPPRSWLSLNPRGCTCAACVQLSCYETGRESLRADCAPTPLRAVPPPSLCAGLILRRQLMHRRECDYNRSASDEMTKSRERREEAKVGTCHVLRSNAPVRREPRLLVLVRSSCLCGHISGLWLTSCPPLP